MQTLEDAHIAVIGLGYVGLPLAVEFAKRYPVIGFDASERRIAELASGHDRTLEVLEAAGSKWNFLRSRPGLVGGHCIGIDPYYLDHKAQEIVFHPEMILAGRRECGVYAVAAPEINAYDAVIVAVAHRQFIAMGIDRVREFCKPGAILFDVKCIFPQDKVDGRL
jgi:UDP-N-acetyl-D-mannosaminuronate dehydrogenase